MNLLHPNLHPRPHPLPTSPQPLLLHPFCHRLQPRPPQPRPLLLPLLHCRGAQDHRRQLPEIEGAGPVERDLGEGHDSGGSGGMCEELGEAVDGEVQACVDTGMRHNKRMGIFFN